jgi:hypothetical protein
MVKKEIRLKYSGLVVFASKLLSVATGLVFTLMIARNITTEEYGIFGNISDILGYFTLLAGVLPFWTARFVARDHAGSAKTGLISNMLISVISASIYLTLLPIILPALRISSAYTIVYAIISIEILELYTLSVLQAILHAKQSQSVMREVHLSQKLMETSRFTVSQHIQDTLIKEAHNKPKYAKTDLKPFLTIF